MWHVQRMVDAEDTDNGQPVYVVRAANDRIVFLGTLADCQRKVRNVNLAPEDDALATLQAAR